MDVQGGSEDVGATPLSANYKDAIEQQIQQGKQNMWKSIKQAPSDYWQYRTGGATTIPQVLQAWGGKRVGEDPNKPVPSEIVNPKHWIWQMMKEVIDPANRAALEQSARKLEFVDHPQSYMSNQGAFGLTTPVSRNAPPPQIGRDVQVAIAPKAMNANIGEAVGSHEIEGHALPLMTKGRPFPYGEKGGMDVVLNELQNPLVKEYTPDYLGRLIAKMRGVGGLPHAGIELQANRQVGQQGFQPLLRNLSDVDPEVAASNADMLNKLLQARR